MLSKTSFAGILHQKLFFFREKSGKHTIEEIMSREYTKNYSSIFGAGFSDTHDEIKAELKMILLLQGNMRVFDKDYTKAQLRWQSRYFSLSPDMQSRIDTDPKISEYRTYLEGLSPLRLDILRPLTYFESATPHQHQ